MKKASLLACCVVAAALCVTACSGKNITVTVEGMHTITLPPPAMKGGKPLMEALKDRKSSRAFSPRRLPDQVLSDLLWAAFGVNRPDKGLRTAPSAVNWQEMDIYVVLDEGIYLYRHKEHSLRPVAKGNFHGMTGVAVQGFVKKAPLNLVYVTDYTKIGISRIAVSDEDRAMFTASHAGFISQNVYLYCASKGLATVVRGLVDRESLGRVLGLTEKQKIIMAQTVGYPAGSDGAGGLIDLSGISDGAYTGLSRSDAFTYEVRVLVKNEKIERIDLLSEQKNRYDAAARDVAARIAGAGSLEVDVVTGATTSSEAIKDAVRDAIDRARAQGTR